MTLLQKHSPAKLVRTSTETVNVRGEKTPARCPTCGRSILAVVRGGMVLLICDGVTVKKEAA